MTTLTLTDLTKTYTSGVTAVADLNLTLDDGELMVLLGPSGCGKTTTLRLISGLIAPTKGDIRFDGQPVLQTPPEKRGAVMVFQQDALFSFMSVGDNVAFGLKMQKLSAETYVNGSPMCSRQCNCPTTNHDAPISCPAGSVNAWRWHGHWLRAPAYCCSTNH